jgi:hypothetical protein
LINLPKILLRLILTSSIYTVTLPLFGGVSTTSSISSPNTITVYEVDGRAEQIRPVVFGRVFKKGEIAQCPQPVVAGAPVDDYQSDVKNRWGDGSVKFAIISFTRTLGPRSGTTISFQNTSSCNNKGYLTQVQMTGFNKGNWGGQIIVTPAGGGAAVTTDAKAMLGANDPGTNTFGDCKNNYWLRGPVVTAVILQDCTSKSAFDFGWAWNGTTMANQVTGNAASASFHPMFILYFYPSANAVRVEPIVELPWVTRIQDQLADIEFKTGSPLTTVWKHGGARKLTDVSATAGSNQITSASAQFSSSDVGLPIAICGSTTGCTNNSGAWYTIASVSSSRMARLSRNFSGNNGSNLIAYINLQVAGSRHRKIFWSGTAPGHIRIDHNFAYLKSTMAFPNYDSGVAVSPDTTGNGNNGMTSWSQWLTGDKGEIGGNGGLNSMDMDYAENSEGAPLQREELLYLYNMTSCGQPGGACAKGWQMLTGEAGAIDRLNCSLTINSSSTKCPDAGGLGAWFNIGNVPFHLRESRTAANGVQATSTNFFYCDNFASKDVRTDGTNPVTGRTGCGTGTANPIGKSLSKHTHSADQWAPGNWPVKPVGTSSNNPGGWSVGGCNHWLDFAYTPYLLTGDYYYLEEEYFSASMCLDGQNPDPAANWGSGRFFGYMNPNGSVLRELAWGLQAVSRAAFIAPDGTAEATYYLSMLNSNLEVQEGAMAISGTGLTPNDTSCAAASVPGYNPNAANRWNWGRCTVMSLCSLSGTCTTTQPALHFASTGSCTTDPTYLNLAVTGSLIQDWMYNFLSVSLSLIRELGYTQAAPVSAELQRGLEERLLDSTYNPYLVGAYESGIKQAGAACNGNGFSPNPFIGSYAQLKSSHAVAIQSVASFYEKNPPAGYINIACGDHGYSHVARAAGSFLQEFETSSVDSNCPNGRCTASDAWKWLSTCAPYFGHAGPAGGICGKKGSQSCQEPSNWKDEQIKFALAPR